MWEPLLDVALRLGLHPRDLARAVDEGLIPVRRMGGRNYVTVGLARTLDLPKHRWYTLAEWAEANGSYYKAVRNMLADGHLKGIDLGPRRRWILEPLDKELLPTPPGDKVE